MGSRIGSQSGSQRCGVTVAHQKVHVARTKHHSAQVVAPQHQVSTHEMAHHQQVERCAFVKPYGLCARFNRSSSSLSESRTSLKAGTGPKIIPVMLS